MTEGLKPEQRRAADLLARNWTNEAVADDVGVAAKTIQRWRNEPQHQDFQDLLKERREELLSEIPAAKTTLEDALSATKSDGSPDWAVRVKAAQLLLEKIPAPPPTSPAPPALRILDGAVAG